MQLHCPICHYPGIITRIAKTCGARECMSAWRKLSAPTREQAIDDARLLDIAKDKYSWPQEVRDSLWMKKYGKIHE